MCRNITKLIIIIIKLFQFCLVLYGDLIFQNNIINIIICRQVLKQCFQLSSMGSIKCFELVCIHSADTDNRVILKQSRQLITALCEESWQPGSTIKLLQNSITVLNCDLLNILASAPNTYTHFNRTACFICRWQLRIEVLILMLYRKW